MSRETLTLAEIDRALKRKKHGKKKAKKRSSKKRSKARRKPKARVKVVHVHHHHGAKSTTHKRSSSKAHKPKKRAKTRPHATGADMSKAQRKAWAKKMQLARKKAQRRK